MSNAAASFRMPCAPYAQAQAPALRALTWLGVAAVHAGLLLWAMQQPEGTLAPRLAQTLSVSFVTEQPVAPQAAPSPPQPAPPPPPAPRLVATPNAASTSAITVPPEPPDVAPEVEAAPSPPSPPVAVSSAATGTEPVVVPPDYRAAYLNNPGPRYPVASRRRREQGLVMLKVHVNAEGAPDQVQIEHGSGFEELDKAAASIVKERWKFVPAQRGNQAVAAWVAVPMEFSLKDR